MMRWEDDNSTAGEYDVLVDGIARAENQRFGGGQGSRGGIEKVGLYVLGRGRAWFDEVYLGPDFTMGFRCPRSSRRGVELRNAGRLKRREGLIDPGQSQNKIMQRHENFLSKREKYTVDNGDLAPFDGDGMRERLVDEYVRDYSDQPHVEGLRAGSLLMVPREEDFVTKRALHYGFARNMDGDGLWSSDTSGSSRAGDTRFWYGEHEAANGTQPWGRGLEKENDWTGGIGACSTDDFVDWKFEGIMLHYANVSDMVLGRKPEGGMVLRQPKTLRLETAATSDSSSSSSSSSSSAYSSNGTTSSTLSNASGSSRDHTASSAVDELYVMWMGAGESNGTFGMSAVATSHYPDGPFSMRRTLYPDGNETHDQTVYIGADGRGYLARTYYAEIEYILPGAVMQPVWDSVKKKDGTVDFGLSYHRAFYSKDYDNYHDIYLQRWRMEDLPWRVTCVDRVTGESRDVPYGEFNEDGGYCNQPAEYKVVLGQGYPVVSSRFTDPEDANNSFWSPESVPLVRAQSWAANYRDGLCGVRKMDEGFDLDDPALDTRSTMDRSNCSNIADNPVHDTLPDKLIGIQTVVETRLAKYVAVSRLTRDLLDTSAIMASFEGELEGQDDLMSLITSNGYHRFDWSAGTEISSTYHSQVYSDFKAAANLESLFRQYQASENDRAWYSLACQLDGTCPVNFGD